MADGIVRGKKLRVPLDSPDKRLVGHTDCLDEAVGRLGHNGQAGSQVTDGLVMAAVDRNLRPVQGLGQGTGEPDRMDGKMVGRGLAVIDRGGELQRDVLIQCSPKADVEEL